MKNIKILSIIAVAGFVLASCSDEVKDSLKDFPNDVTFNVEEKSIDIQVPKLGFIVPSAEYTARAYKDGSIKLNVKINSDGTHSGFALSNKNYMSYPWCNSKPFGQEAVSDTELKSAIDSSIFSVYTRRPNQCKNFAVCRVEGEQAYFTIDKPRIIEHILVANTTYNFLLLSYGSVYSAQLDDVTQAYVPYKKGTAVLAKVRNPNLPDGSATKYGVWYLPDYYKFNNGKDYISISGQQKLARIEAGHNAAELARKAGKSEKEIVADSTAAANAVFKAWVKLTAKGYLNGKQIAKSEHYLATLQGNAPAPYDKWDMVQASWARWDLKSLGLVDKVVFEMQSSDVNTPPYFCIDGIRLE